jgi:hypothetical protein
MFIGIEPDNKSLSFLALSDFRGLAITQNFSIIIADFQEHFGSTDK